MWKIIIFSLIIPLGIFVFIYGGYDDSPGAQLLGAIIVALAIRSLVRAIRHRSK